MSITKALVIAVAALAMHALTLGGTAGATTISVDDTVTFANGTGSLGGEYLATVNDSWSFITFTVQHTEYIGYTSTFTVEGVNTYAETDPVRRGGDAFGHDELSPQTAYLYTMFVLGTLDGYAYDGPRQVSSANLLQMAIWMLERDWPANRGNKFVKLANEAVNSGAWSGIGNVRVLNLSYGGGEGRDVLWLDPITSNDPPDPDDAPDPNDGPDPDDGTGPNDEPDGGSGPTDGSGPSDVNVAIVTPEPASLVLLGTGLTFVATRMRRRR